MSGRDDRRLLLTSCVLFCKLNKSAALLLSSKELVELCWAIDLSNRGSVIFLAGLILLNDELLIRFLDEFGEVGV